MIIKSVLTIISFTLLVGCNTKKDNDPFYLLEGNTIKVLEIENEKLKLSISKTHEETTTLSIQLTELYNQIDIKKIKIGDRIIKKSESYDLIIRRDGSIIDTLHRVILHY